MTILNRPTLVDRPEVVNRGDEEDEQDTKEPEGTPTETLGEGGGPTIHHLEFEPGDFDVVAASNAAAVLSTGDQQGDIFEQSFINSAVQLKELKEAGEDITDLVRFAVEKNVADIGLTEAQVDVLRDDTPEDDKEEQEAETEEEPDADEDDGSAGEEEVETDSTEEEGSDIEELEEDLEEVKPEE